MMQRVIRIQDSGFSGGERGFSLISALFLLVVIAALGMFAVTLSTNQQQSASLDLLGSRAYQAARAGIEWGAFQVRTPGGAVCPAPTPIVLAAPELNPFTVTVGCVNSGSQAEAGITVTVYQLTSTARLTNVAAGAPGYVERQMTAAVER